MARYDRDEAGDCEELEAAIALGSKNSRVHWQLIEFRRDRWLARDIFPSAAHR